MALGRKKNSYVSIGEFEKVPEAEHAALEVEDVEFEADHAALEVEHAELAFEAEPVDPAVPEIELATPEADLADIAARVSEVRRHISNARVEVVAQQETLGENAASAEAAVIAPQSVFSAAAGLDRRFVDDIDESDVERIENRFFDERPVSIEEGMKQADEAHVRQRKGTLVIAVIAVLLVVGLGLVVFGLSGVSGQNSESAEGNVQVSAQGEDLADAPPPSMRLYQTSEYGEADVSVYEIMEFDQDGLCSKMKLEAAFSNGAAAEAFLADMRETHGSNCVDSYVDGTTGVVVIDVSSQGMSKDEYLARAGVEFEDPDVQEIPEDLTT